MHTVRISNQMFNCFQSLNVAHKENAVLTLASLKTIFSKLKPDTFLHSVKLINSEDQNTGPSLTPKYLSLDAGLIMGRLVQAQRRVCKDQCCYPTFNILILSVSHEVR